MSKYRLPKGYSVFQIFLRTNEFLANPVKFMAKSMEKFSGTYTASIGIARKVILTQNPDFINYVLKENHKNYKKSELSTGKAVSFFGNGLLFSNGEYWLKQRRLIQPAFHKEKIKGLYDIVIKAIDDSLNQYPTGDAIDIYPLVHRTSFDIIIKSLFDIEISEASMNELNEILTVLQDFLMTDINKPLKKIWYPITGERKRMLIKAKKLRSIFAEIIQNRKTSNTQYADLLDMLLHSKYEDTGLVMNEEQVIDELVILIFAGHETTANTLSWLIYLLANNTNCVEKLTDSFKENSILDSLNNDYLKATINEGMRLYPAAWMTERVAIADDNFEAYLFPKDTIVIPFFFGLHRLKDVWKNETDFLPERFIEDPSLARSKYFFPFGAGPRMCIGNNFAIAEMSFFLYVFFKRFTIEPTTIIPIMKPLITLRPDKVVLKVIAK
jgi:cytochrome P450